MVDCLFCRMVTGEVPADVVADDERALAFRDINPQAPVHVLVIPKEHHPDVATLAASDPETLAALHAIAARVVAEEGVAEAGWRLVFNTGAGAGQSVFHVHGHVLGGRPFNWPPG
jgi:histidine triad (HIT) family protein